MSHDVPSLEIDDLRDVLIRSGNSYVEDTRDRTSTSALRHKLTSPAPDSIASGEPFLLVQNPNKLLDPFKWFLILFARVHNAIPIALQRFRFHFAQAAGKERGSNGLGSGVQPHDTPPLAIEPQPATAKKSRAPAGSGPKRRAVSSSKSSRSSSR